LLILQAIKNPKVPSGNHTHCLICNSAQLEKFGEFIDGRMVKCAKCGFVFASPIPTIQELIDHYDGYRRDDYLSPITIKRYHEILDTFEPYRKNNRLIDVGCGIGYFLSIAKQRGWEVHGTEYTDKAIEICTSKGISMKQGPLNPANYEPGYFDVVTSFEVIEHINNPRTELGYFNQILRPGGIVYFTTPNFNSLSRYISGTKWSVIVYPEHLCYYTPETVDLAFRNAGFDCLQLQTTGFSVTRLKKTSFKSDQKLISNTSDDELLRNKMETDKIWKLAKYLLNSTLDSLQVGDSLKGTYHKV
jgi:2-polyprenyl-3-methyl-5-hydroxy-6-metoxy-1,4-benzoquinol methylase